MRKLIGMLFFAVFMTGLLQANDAATEKPVVLATATMIADMARNIAGDNVVIDCIVPIGGDPHTYNPTPADAKKVYHAKLVLRNGLTFEGWLDELIEHSGTSASVATVTEGIEVIKSLQYDSPDPHAWMDIQKGIQYSENIKDALIKLDPANQTVYEANYARYRSDLEALDAYIVEAIQTIPEEHRILITSHDAFQYYGTRYGLRLESVLGISTDADAQTDDVLNLQRVIKQSNVPAVFVESTVNPKMLQQIAKDTGIRIGGKLLSDSLGDKKTGGETYIDMMRQNTDVIVSGLKDDVSEDTDTEIATDTSNQTMNYIFTGAIALLLLAGLIYMMVKMNR